MIEQLATASTRTGNSATLHCQPVMRSVDQKMMYGPMATVDSVGIKSFESQPQNLDAAKELGRKLAEALKV